MWLRWETESLFDDTIIPCPDVRWEETHKDSQFLKSNISKCSLLRGTHIFSFSMCKASKSNKARCGLLFWKASKTLCIKSGALIPCRWCCLNRTLPLARGWRHVRSWKRSCQGQKVWPLPGTQLLRYHFLCAVSSAAVGQIKYGII